MNANKTQCLLFQPKFGKTPATTNTIDLKLGNTTLSFSTSVRFLGTWLDHQLNWNHHFQTLIYKIQKNRILLQVSQKYLPPSTKVLVYYARIYSHISYCIRIWGNMITKTQLKQLQIEQNKCIRLIVPSNCTEEIYKKFKLANITQIIKAENCKLGYQIDRNTISLELYKVITEDSKGKTLLKTHDYATRNKSMPNLPKSENSKYHNSFLYRGIKEFCSLPQNIKDLETFPRFKTKLKDHLLK